MLMLVTAKLVGGVARVRAARKGKAALMRQIRCPNGGRGGKQLQDSEEAKK